MGVVLSQHPPTLGSHKQSSIPVSCAISTSNKAIGSPSFSLRHEPLFACCLWEYPSAVPIRVKLRSAKASCCRAQYILNGNLVSEDQKLQLVHNSTTSLSKLYCSIALWLELNLLFVFELVGLLLLIIQSQIWELFWWWKIVWSAAAFEVFICRVKLAS